MTEYQPALEPFHEPDLWDAVTVPAPEVLPSLPLRPTEAWEQSSLDLGLPVSENRPIRPGRKHVTEMANLAIRLGYADSPGELIDQAVGLRQYRLHNAMLAVLQRPHAQHLLSDSAWRNQWQRTVVPGQHPIVLLVPGGPLMFLFDVSQTEPLPGARSLPRQLTNPFESKEVVQAGVAIAQIVSGAKSFGVRVASAPYGNALAGCIRRTSVGVEQISNSGQIVAVRFDLLLKDVASDAERLTTLAHELGHLFCGHLGAERGDSWTEHTPAHAVREYEAEMTALAVLKRLAPDIAVPSYLDQFYAPGESPGEASWDRAMRAAALVVDLAQTR